MPNKALLILVLAFITGTVNQSFAQNDCPSLPSRAKFDTLGYISANIPTDPSNAAGKLYLGQGWANRQGIIRPGFIPSNRPSWAIAIAVAWNLGRNTVQRVEYPNMNYWMATLIQETELRCATGLTWSDPSHVPDAYNPSTVYAAQINNGCLQIEGPGSAWSALQQAYPNGRIPISANTATNTALYDQLVEGVDGFEASALVKMYYDSYTSQIFNYNVGWDFYENVDCKQNNGYDPYAYTKMSASNYNGGPNGFLNAKGELDNTGPGLYGQLPATTASYGRDIARWVSVLEDNTGYADYPAGSSWDSWYDDAVPFSEVQKYLDLIEPMYPDVDWVGTMVPAVEAAFIAKGGSLGATINFTDFGEVVDAIVLNLPNDKPTPVDGSPIGIDLGCSGDFLPYGHVDILNGTTTMCLGRSVTLELIVDAGNDPNIQFKWFKGDVETGTLIGTNKQITITPNALGTEVYSGQICNGNGCYTVYSNNQNSCQDPRNINGFNVTANDCNLCPFIASGTAVNAVCKGTPDGSITLNLTNAPANYRITYVATTPVGNDTVSWETSGNTVQIDDIRDGAYNFVLEDLGDPSCITYTNVLVGYDTDINEYIEANLLGVANCEADLGADIKEHPAPCLWKVQVHTPIYFQWEAWVNAVVKTSTGKILIQKDTRVAPKPELDQWNNSPVSEFWLSLETGDQITVGTALTTTPGASQLREYEFNIFDEANNNVYTANSPAGSSSFGINHDAGTYTVTCPQNVPDYSIAWSPSINNEVTTATNSTGDVNVQNDDRVYYVTATNNTNPQCILKDSVTVLGDPLCGTVCANPGDVTLVDAANVKLTDTIRACADTTIYTNQVNNDPGTFLFELFKDGVAQTPTNNTGEFTLTDEGQYWVLVSDDADAGNSDCHVYSDTIQFINLTVPTAPEYKSGDTVVCAGVSSVSLEITTSQSATSYNWRYTGTGLTFNPIPTDSIASFDVALNATDGDIIVVGSNVCGADSVIIPIRVEVLPEVDLGNDTTVCAANGAFTLDADNVGADYEWQDASVDKIFDVTTTGDYWVIASNGSCSDTDSVSITVAGSAILELGNDTSICDSDLTLDIGVGFTSITWQDGSTNQTFLVTTTGEYYVDVEDANGCVGSDTIDVQIGTSPTVDLGNDTNICAAGGVLTLDADNVGADFLWEPDNEIIQTIDVTTTGEYKVEVTVDGCSTRDSITITVDGSAVLDLGPDTTFCSDLGNIVLDAGAGFTSYTWSNGALTQDITVSASGTYDVEVEDANGCIGNDTIVVTINQTPTVDLGADTVTICATSPDVTFDAGNAGATFAWNSGEGTQSIQKGNSDAGDYWVLVTQNNCTASDTVNLTVATELTVDLGVDQEICTGTTLTLDAGFGAGFTFDWNNGGAQNDQTFIAGQGQVTVEVADAGGCSGRDTINITEINPLVIDLGTDQEICAGDAAVSFSMMSGRSDLTVVGWQDATTGLSLSTDQAGVYWLEVDSAGCVFRDSVELKLNALPSVDLGTDTFICVGTTPIITLTGGTFTSYQWADITTGILVPLGVGETQDVSTVGTYGLVVTDANACINGDTVQVTEEQGTQVGFAIDTTICPAGSATISVPNNLQGVVGASWAWFNDGSTGTDFTVTGEPDGTVVEVILDFTNEFGCVTRDTAVVRVDNNLPISLRDTAICEGEDITFPSGYPVAGYTYIWQDASTGNDLTITGATIADGGNISVDITSDEGCTGNANVILTINTLPNPQLSAAPICLGEDRILDHGLTGVVSVWDHGEITNPITVTTQGLYRVTVTDANNCEDTVSVSLVVNTPPVLNLPVDQTLCDGESYALGTGLNDATYTHQWSGGSTATTADLSVTTNGQYIINVTEDATSCSSVDTINFNFLVTPLVDLGGDLDLCEGDFTVLSSPGTNTSYTYNWSTGVSNTDITVNSTSEYWLEVTNKSCSHRDSVSVAVFTNPVSELMNDIILCFDDLDNGLSLDPGRNGVAYTWSTGDTSQVITVDQRGTYLVAIENAAGCVTTDHVEIKEDCPAHVWLPNAVSMDGNGINDVWTIQGRSIETVEVLVYNRWGELIWEGNAIGQFWDGTHQQTNKEVQQDVYVYHLKYSYLNVNGRLEQKQRVGHFSLLR